MSESFKAVTQSTPGPWGWEYAQISLKPVALSGESQDVLIATSDIDGYTFVDISPANARLIAAAPDMYDKLVEVEKVISEWPTLHEGGDYLHGWILNSIRDILDKAKPKAEGEPR